MSANKRRKARKKSTKKRATKVEDSTRVVPVKKKAAKRGKPNKEKGDNTRKAAPAKKRGKKKASSSRGSKTGKQGAKGKRKLAAKAAADTDKASKRKSPKKQAKPGKPSKKAGKKKSGKRKPSKKAVLTRARKRRDKGKAPKQPVKKLRAKLRQRGITLQVTYGPGDASVPKPTLPPAGSASGLTASATVPPPNIRLPDDRWEGFGSQPTIVLPTPTNKIRSKVYLVTMGREANFSEDDRPGEDIVRFTTSTSGMHSSNDNYLQIFDKAFRHFVDKTPFEDRDDVPFYRFGMAIRSKYKLDEKKIRELIPKFADLAQKIVPKGASAHVVDEGQFLSVRINLGNYREPTLYTEAREYIRKNKQIFEALRLGAADLLDGDFVWFEFWDTDELYY